MTPLPPDPLPLNGMSREQANTLKAEVRRMEADPSVGKHGFRLYLQSSMPCGHLLANLLMCDRPPFGCLECLTEAL